MISSNNPNLSRPEVLFQEFAHLDINTHRFSGKRSFDGTKCGVEMVRTVVSRRHDVIDMFAPSGMEHSELELREY